MVQQPVGNAPRAPSNGRASKGKASEGRRINGPQPALTADRE